MPRPIQDGAYYEFNRPDGHYEFGSEIQESTAQTHVRYGFDVYTPRASDAKALAKKVAPYPPSWHPGYSYNHFPHYHPEGEDYGHISYGRRREDFEH
jgi:hypothetical protein